MGLIRETVNQLKDYVPGKTPSDPKAIKLSSNENPFGPSPKAIDALKKAAGHSQVYPDQRSLSLREALGRSFGLPDDSVIVGNGSDEIMLMIATAFLSAGEEALISRNSFSLYEFITRLLDGRPVFVPLNNNHQDLGAIAAAITTKTKLIFLTNPHNPTGTYLPATELDAFLANVPQEVLVVIDEAYAEFATAADFPKSVEFIRRQPNVIVLRTFSKYYGLAGLRIGYGLARPELIAPLFKIKLPFNVNHPAQAAAEAALADKRFLEKTLRNNLDGKKQLYSALDSLGLKYTKSEANFVFVDLKKPAAHFCEEMMRRGVSVRPLTSFGFPEAIRVSIGTKEQNARFISQLKTVL
ncbi:histidinol-phosphate transaminase [candidate division WOR-1 bacterium RIFOXYA12_FULL_52_29]|uniref:Histidinol-phosphate aminotransferase n=1 Tax=candidate division WOR-1 bacterium RIFOXYC12_FULL_54_18 TaxID=1802584 RepID=A0A1F4T6R6_UNCSA|nr:MAG: histidinol-phosphate transaminase [candidate division WOR-1 bacterium RIFOXYA2_FULL_51_19]OGC18001.1 MAG: histidinol-phosphate transaminase [candidate division WOR-1 bacterium RIFOXYA12_FULL_52_29]OGC26857.1 MAG: histidinol-phosphate transaminase [candidate division WOR-1 bacterium RIFOXYB2_FULL_45_9]OGC28418.1 MAG: histidinol-phosphate transaminase [candidate division WOR-1 bacterium RIFOXYC12_FULL_54_18]OGC31127.1 MAG: histidinol-phosphate transaminase [candidate division WOR-1 bacter